MSPGALDLAIALMLWLLMDGEDPPGAVAEAAPAVKIPSDPFIVFFPLQKDRYTGLFCDVSRHPALR